MKRVRAEGPVLTSVLCPFLAVQALTSASQSDARTNPAHCQRVTRLLCFGAEDFGLKSVHSSSADLTFSSIRT
jgi:hypothetical protein